VKEESVFWLGSRPGTTRPAGAPPEGARLEPTVLAACRAQGVVPGEFVAALGGFGSWLVHFERAGRRARLVWNGRERRLVLQGALRSGGWEDLGDCPVADAGEAGLATAIAHLLSAPVPG
jgi:hypothetical protein